MINLIQLGLVIHAKRGDLQVYNGVLKEGPFIECEKKF